MNCFTRFFIKVGMMYIPTFILGQSLQPLLPNDFVHKNLQIPGYIDFRLPDKNPTTSVTIDISDTIGRASPYIYGNNANIYMTQVVTEPDLIKYITELSPCIIRYPGGNLSNLFFWDVIPGHLPENIPDTLYTFDNQIDEYWFGRNDSSITLSVDNYYKMLEETNSTGDICVNYSYARYGTGDNPVADAAHYAAEWVRYDNGRTHFWEIGNENYGPWQAGFKIDSITNRDGQSQIISGELYGKHFNVFADSMRAAANEINNDIKIGAVLVEAEKENNWNEVEEEWNKGFFSSAGNNADFFIIHSYYTPWNDSSGISTILESPPVVTQEMMDYIIQVCKENNVDMKPVALTEWNIFAFGHKQPCSYIGGIHAAMVLGELIKNKYGMACRWNFANGYANGDDHGMFNKGDEPGVPKWNPRPSFFYMYYFRKYFGNYMMNSEVQGSNNIITYASSFDSGEKGLVLINRGNSEESVSINLMHSKILKDLYVYILKGGNDRPEFSQQVYVNNIPPDYATGGPVNELENIKAFHTEISGNFVMNAPPYSVQFIILK